MPAHQAISERLLGERRCSDWFRHLNPQFGEATEQVAHSGLFLALVEVLMAQITVRLAVCKHMIGGHKDGVSSGHDGSFLASAGGQAMIPSIEITVFGASGRPGGLIQGGKQPAIAPPGATRVALASGLVVARCDARPTGQVVSNRVCKWIDLNDACASLCERIPSPLGLATRRA